MSGAIVLLVTVGTTFLGASDPRVIAAIVGGVVALVVALASAPLRLVVESLLQRQKARLEYEYAQRARLQSEVGAFHGRLHEAATLLNYRLVNLELNQEKNWLRVEGNFTNPERRYFRTTIYRFAVFIALANRFERAILHIDARAAADDDTVFVSYVKAMRWALTDASLFREEPYDPSEDTAHFYTDELRQMCSTVLDGDGDAIDLGAFGELIEGEHELEKLMVFFDGLAPDLDGGLKWDRLMVFRLFLMGFVDEIGFKFEQTDDKWYPRAANLISHPSIAGVAAEWIPKFNLEKRKSARKVSAALRSRAQLVSQDVVDTVDLDPQA